MVKMLLLLLLLLLLVLPRDCGGAAFAVYAMHLLPLTLSALPPPRATNSRRSHKQRLPLNNRSMAASPH
jgi:hypothetical protein